jgi:hypothetical protein
MFLVLWACRACQQALMLVLLLLPLPVLLLLWL